MARLQRGPHHADIARTVEGVVAPAIRALDEFLLYTLAAELGGVHELGRAEFLGPVLLGVVDVHDDDLAGAVLDGALDHG